ncbi:hypothetical protein BJX64DRAFT_271944 [Aspergillus heterothallicus]
MVTHDVPKLPSQSSTPSEKIAGKSPVKSPPFLRATTKTSFRIPRRWHLWYCDARVAACHYRAVVKNAIVGGRIRAQQASSIHVS